MTEDTSLRKEIKSLERQLDKFVRESSVNDAKMQSDIGFIKTTLTKLETLVSNHYVSRTEFEPIKKLVYGTVAVILTGVIGMAMTLMNIR